MCSEDRSGFAAPDKSNPRALEFVEECILAKKQDISKFIMNFSCGFDGQLKTEKNMEWSNIQLVVGVVVELLVEGMWVQSVWGLYVQVIGAWQQELDSSNHRALGFVVEYI